MASIYKATIIQQRKLMGSERLFGGSPDVRLALCGPTYVCVCGIDWPKDCLCFGRERMDSVSLFWAEREWTQCLCFGQRENGLSVFVLGRERMDPLSLFWERERMDPVSLFWAEREWTHCLCFGRERMDPLSLCTVNSPLVFNEVPSLQHTMKCRWLKWWTKKV